MNNQLTFKQFLYNILETVDDDIAALNIQKQQLTMKKATQDQQIDTQIDALNRVIFQKEKQKQSDVQKMDKTAPSSLQQPTQQQAQQSGTATTTPGSSGAQTPGGGASSAAVPMR